MWTLALYLPMSITFVKKSADRYCLGAVGWTLSASFGYCSASWCSYQSDLSLFWASVAYTIGSVLLWYEALDKYPVEVA